MEYIRNKNLLDQMKIYFETGTRTEKLGEMLLLLAKRYSDKGNFSGYSWKDDMIGEAVLTCIKYMHNFDINKEDPNPFAYFSTIIRHSFVTYIIKQKKHSQIKDICYKNIDFIIPDINSYDDYSNFKICSIDYQPIRGNRKKRTRKKKDKE